MYYIGFHDTYCTASSATTPAPIHLLKKIDSKIWMNKRTHFLGYFPKPHRAESPQTSFFPILKNLVQANCSSQFYLNNFSIRSVNQFTCKRHYRNKDFSCSVDHQACSVMNDGKDSSLFQKISNKTSKKVSKKSQKPRLKDTSLACT